MTENMLQQLEEKMMALISEVEMLRRELAVMRLENSNLKVSQDKHTKKVQDIIALLDTVSVEHAMPVQPAVSLQPIMVQSNS